MYKSSILCAGLSKMRRSSEYLEEGYGVSYQVQNLTLSKMPRQNPQSSLSIVLTAAYSKKSIGQPDQKNAPVFPKFHMILGRLRRLLPGPKLDSVENPLSSLF
jgi:hypothetical protein